MVTQKLSEELYKNNMPKKEIRKRTASKGYSWFSSWRRNNQAEDPENDKKPNDSSAKVEGSLRDGEVRVFALSVSCEEMWLLIGIGGQYC